MDGEPIYQIGNYNSASEQFAKTNQISISFFGQIPFISAAIECLEIHTFQHEIWILDIHFQFEYCMDVAHSI